jgi:hypothetical protein
VPLEKGEAVAVTAPMTRKDFLRITGMTEAQMRHCARIAEIADHGDDWWRLMRTEQDRRSQRAERAVVRQLHCMLARRRA